MKIQFNEAGWEQFQYWFDKDKKTLKKINRLLADISRNGHEGIGHPEPLKGELSGFWSREIDEKNRLVYTVVDDVVVVIQCRSHYGDR